MDITGKPKPRFGKPKLDPVIDTLLKTGLFVKVGTEFQRPTIKLIGTPYQLVEWTPALDSSQKTVFLARKNNGLVWKLEGKGKVVSLGEIFDDAPPDVIEKLAFYLNMLPR